MKNKLITFNLITISLVIFIITATGNYFYQKAMTKSRLIYTTELQKQLSNSFNQKIRSVEKVLDIILQSEDVANYLTKEDKNISNKILKEQKVRDLFESYSQIYPEFLSLVLISEDGKDYISNDSYRIVNDSFDKEPWFQEAMEEGESYEFYNSIRNLKSWKIYDNHTFFSIAKLVEVGGKKVGVLLVDLSLTELRDSYRELEFDTNNFFFLMNSSGQVILSPSNEIVHRIKSEWFTEDEGVIRAEILNREYNLIYNKYRDKKLVIVSAYDVLKEQDVLKTFFQLSLTIAMIAFVLAITWSIYFVSKVTKPIVKLSNLMQRASTGNLEVRFEEECDTEIQSLGDAFNKMVIKIKQLLDIVYSEQQEKRESELQVMQEQIKPHFLYSTLDMVSDMAVEHKVFDIVNVIKMMSDFFKISLEKGKDLIPLEDELRMVRNYMDIQILRYENIFSFNISCPKNLEKSLVPRMCLQPLVENSIFHGIRDSKTQNLKIKITVMEEEKGVTILVENTGNSIHSSIMRQLNYNLAHDDWTEWEGGFGIQHVGKRLSHTFGKGSGLSYYIDKKGSTVAKVTIFYQDTEKQN